MNLFSKILNLIDRETTLGVGLWLLVFLAFALFRFQYDHFTTSFDKTIAGLEVRTIYLEKITSEACVGDIVNYHSPSLERRYIREIGASAGSFFQITSSGYSVDGTAVEMNEDWVKAAKQIVGNQEGITIASGQSLIINSEFDSPANHNSWPFEVIENQQISAKVTHILFSRDFFKIGNRVGNVEGCI